MKTIILAGGLGSRMREETEFKPKPMVEIGGKPVIWHIIKTIFTKATMILSFVWVTKKNK
ncbi:hypothetical protein CM15mP35_05650 [bacterium]|nr:MAG: hypothetical protein CM15mP35_05650 [bacterium]